MRLRWGRILGALGVSLVAVNSLPLVPLWLTMPDAQVVERSSLAAHARDCGTGEALTAAAAAHPEHGDPDGGAADVAALAAVRDAGRCTRLTALDTYTLFHGFTVTNHALHALDPVARPAEAVDGALAVWELAADQQRAGTLIHAAVWLAIGQKASEILDVALLQGLDDARLAELQARLTRIATADLDWNVVASEEERGMWEWMPLAHDIRGPVPLPWRFLVAARQGRSPGAAEFRDTEREMRTRAAVLAGAAEMERHRRSTGACPGQSDVLRDVAARDLDLQWLPDRCAVLGAFEGGAVVAMAR